MLSNTAPHLMSFNQSTIICVQSCKLMIFREPGEYLSFTRRLNKGVVSNDAQVPRGSIVVMSHMHMHGEEPLSLVRSERTGLFVYGCS